MGERNMKALTSSGNKWCFVALICQVVSLVCMCLPCCFFASLYSSTNHYFYNLLAESHISFLGNSYAYPSIFGNIALMAALLSICAFLLCLSHKSDKWLFVVLSFSAASISLLFLLVVTVIFYFMNIVDYSTVLVHPTWFMYVVFALQTTVVVISLLLSFDIIGTKDATVRSIN